jgi:phosphatidate cytidylyltransferase
LFVTTSILLILTAVEGQFNPLLLSFIFAILFWSVLIKNKVEGAIDQLIYPLFGLFFITVPLAVMLLLRQTTAGEGALLAVLVTLWGVDSFAYLGGVRFGKRPLAPVFSPKKSVEGLIFGFLGGAFLLFLLNSYHIQLFTPIGIVAFALMMTLFGQGGDLLESCIKRTGGCKDSGSLIPGHGGLLDRIDSLLFSLPVAYAWFTISKSSIIGGLF